MAATEEEPGDEFAHLEDRTMSCRTCGGATEMGTSLLFPCNKRFLEWVSSYMGLEVSLKNGLPHRVCYVCVSNMRTWLVFNHRCKAEQARLLALRGQPLVVKPDSHRRRRLSFNAEQLDNITGGPPPAAAASSVSPTTSTASAPASIDSTAVPATASTSASIPDPVTVSTNLCANCKADLNTPKSTTTTTTTKKPKPKQKINPKKVSELKKEIDKFEKQLEKEVRTLRQSPRDKSSKSSEVTAGSESKTSAAETLNLRKRRAGGYFEEEEPERKMPKRQSKKMVEDVHGGMYDDIIDNLLASEKSGNAKLVRPKRVAPVSTITKVEVGPKSSESNKNKKNVPKEVPKKIKTTIKVIDKVPPVKVSPLKVPPPTVAPIPPPVAAATGEVKTGEIKTVEVKPVVEAPSEVPVAPLEVKEVTPPQVTETPPVVQALPPKSTDPMLPAKKRGRKAKSSDTSKNNGMKVLATMVSGTKSPKRQSEAAVPAASPKYTAPQQYPAPEQPQNYQSCALQATAPPKQSPSASVPSQYPHPISAVEKSSLIIEQLTQSMPKNDTAAPTYKNDVQTPIPPAPAVQYTVQQQHVVQYTAPNPQLNNAYPNNLVRSYNAPDTQNYQNNFVNQPYISTPNYQQQFYQSRTPFQSVTPPYTPTPTPPAAGVLRFSQTFSSAPLVYPHIMRVNPSTSPAQQSAPSPNYNTNFSPAVVQYQPQPTYLYQQQQPNSYYSQSGYNYTTPQASETNGSGEQQQYGDASKVQATNTVFLQYDNRGTK